MARSDLDEVVLKLFKFVLDFRSDVLIGDFFTKVLDRVNCFCSLARFSIIFEFAHFQLLRAESTKIWASSKSVRRNSISCFWALASCIAAFPLMGRTLKRVL